MPKTIQKNIRITPEQWKCLEKTAREWDISPNQLIVNLVIDALDRNEWPGTETEIRVARELIAAGKEEDVQEIRDLINTIVPYVSTETNPPNRPDRQ